MEYNKGDYLLLTETEADEGVALRVHAVSTDDGFDNVPIFNARLLRHGAYVVKVVEVTKSFEMPPAE